MAYITFKDSPGKKHKCSVRLIRICQDNGFRRLSDLSSLTYSEILRVPECGETTAKNIKEILNKYGLDFRENQRAQNREIRFQIEKNCPKLSN